MLVAIKENRWGKLTQVLFLLHDNKPAHRVTHWTGYFTWIWICRNASSLSLIICVMLSDVKLQYLTWPATSTIFSWPVTKWLPSCFQIWQSTSMDCDYWWWWAELRHQKVAKGTVWTFLFYRHWKTPRSLLIALWQRWWYCWKINVFSSVSFSFK